jgi:hypothetical protein
MKWAVLVPVCLLSLKYLRMSHRDFKYSNASPFRKKTTTTSQRKLTSEGITAEELTNLLSYLFQYFTPQSLHIN